MIGKLLLNAWSLKDAVLGTISYLILVIYYSTSELHVFFIFSVDFWENIRIKQVNILINRLILQILNA